MENAPPYKEKRKNIIGSQSEATLDRVVGNEF